jgi:acyl dehydratase
MADFDPTKFIGTELPGAVVTIERGPLAVFAEAVKDSNPIYQSAEAAQAAGFEAPPVPPTFPFAMGNFGRFREQQPEGWYALGPMAEVFGELMSKGGLILHGEQEFLYYAPVVAGDVLTMTGRISDIYTKESNGKTMTFVVSEQDYTNQRGEHVLRQVSTILHRV